LISGGDEADPAYSIEFWVLFSFQAHVAEFLYSTNGASDHGTWKTVPDRHRKTRHREALREFRAEDLRPAELASIVARHRNDWRLTQATNARNFIEYLLTRTRLKEVRLAAESYPEAKEIVRYVWGQSSAYALALSLMRDAYLCYGTAVFLHL
jgi:hypothetical protein